MVTDCSISAPNEVPLVVKETKDSCNSGKDIDFQLVGFTLDGQVILCCLNSMRGI